MQKYLFILCGLPFTGKTTLAKIISNQFNFPYVELDMINRNRGIGVKGRNVTQEEWKETYEISYKQTIDLLRKGKSVLSDATNFTVEQRNKLKELAKSNKGIPVIIFFNIPEKEARRRLIENRKSNYRYDVKDEDFNEVANNFQPPTNKEGQILTYNQNDASEDWIEKNLSNLLNNSLDNIH